jgi:hypothetical protein
MRRSRNDGIIRRGGRALHRHTDAVRSAPSQRTCGHVFDAFLNHCASLQQMGGMEAITVAAVCRSPMAAIAFSPRRDSVSPPV